MGVGLGVRASGLAENWSGGVGAGVGAGGWGTGLVGWRVRAGVRLRDVG